jgi:hypothetical protein
MNNINVLKTKFTNWRANRKRRHERIPSELWAEAVAVAQTEGCNAIISMEKYK